MYLRKLEISGFKSFGSREALDLDQGIMAVVGPNGSGKSNIADALRWVLGEQSIKNLRLKKSEDLIFAGSNKKSQSSMAKVSILLDNSDDMMPIDFKEINITRQLYRSGESDFFLNKNKVRLSDITQILLQSGFGQNTYSVIGQGMIDNLILATGQERKELFEEASGIKQFEFKKQQALKKLEKTRQNLARTNDIIAELKPQQQILSTQVKKLADKKMLSQNLDRAREDYLSYHYKNYSLDLANYKGKLQELNDKLESIEKEISGLHLSQKKNDKDSANLTRELKLAESKRDTIIDNLAKQNAQKEIIDMQIKFNTSKNLGKKIRILEKKRSDLERKLFELEKDIKSRAVKLNDFDAEVILLNKKLDQARASLADVSTQNYLKYALALTRVLMSNLSRPVLTLEEHNIALTKLEKMIHLAKKNDSQKLSEKIKLLQKQITHTLTQKDNLNEDQTARIIRSRAIEIDLLNIKNQIAQLDISIKESPQDYDKNKHSKLKHDLKVIDKKIRSLRDEIFKTSLGETKHSRVRLSTQLEKLSSDKTRIKMQIAQVSQEIKLINQKAEETLDRSTQWFGRDYQIKNKKTVGKVELEQITKLQTEIEVLEEIDPGLEEQYGSNEKRIEFLINQHDDLERAASDLENIINNLDKNIKDKFKKSFSEINKYFNQYFSELFNGGKANLALAKDSFQNYGIEIKANLPGKRMELLSTLSGGEKTLTAVALLIAIVTVNPSPFIVLDEVDAALDDVNCAKFSKILQRISHKSQIIIITHNHQTMKIASKLFGITSGFDGLSRVLSVKLKQAEQMVLEPSN